LPAQAKYGGGTGEPNDQYLIYTAEQMNEIGLSVNSDDWDKHFKLMADIDLSGFTGTSFNIIEEFKGVFDGNGHTISNFNYTTTSTAYIGLFAGIYGENAEIKDMGLIDPEVDAGTGNIVEVGSMVGINDQGTISNCYVKGGSVGCSAIIWSSAGGLVGSNKGTIINCYAAADVSGTMNVGGLVGNNSGTITNCYSIGSITGGYNVGGLVGRNVGEVWASFWDIETSEQTTSAGGEGKTTAEMQDTNTFIDAGWGCDSFWTIDNGKDYPRLLWENSPGEPLSLFSGGSGTPADPYLISTSEQLNTIGLFECIWDKHFKLMADIDLSAYMGTSFNIIGSYNYPFTGVFDGNNHAISNYTYTSTDTYYIGLFGGVEGEIKDLGLIAPDVDAGTGRFVGSLVGSLIDGTVTNCYVEGGSIVGDNSVGGLVGFNWGGLITECSSSASVLGGDNIGGLLGYNLGMVSNCYSTGSVTGDDYSVGGLVGYNWEGTISNSYATGNVRGTKHVGGLVGSNYEGTISDCYSIASVSGEGYVGGLVGKNDVESTISNCCSSANVSGYYDVGGLVGQNDGGAITYCYSTANVVGNSYVGGLVGHNSAGTITNCCAIGGVTGEDYVGGLVGYNLYGTITNCYSIGSVTGRYPVPVGGLVGYNEEGEVIASFWDIETSGQGSSAGGTGRSTSHMQTASTFIAWGCDPVWTIDEGKDYPRLFWENMPGEPITTPSYGGGSGTQADPYLIYTAEQLNTIGLVPCHLDKHFLLCADIDLSDYDYFRKRFNIIGKHGVYRLDPNDFQVEDISDGFKGVFDGAGYTIANFTYQKDNMIFETYCIGLFGYVDDPNAQIKDLGMINPTVDVNWGYYGAASLVGRLNNGTITNCYIEGGSIGAFSHSDNIGGLVGYNSEGTISNCYSDNSVSGIAGVGGLIGSNHGSITNSYSIASVSGALGAWPGGEIGGLVGENYGTIINCYATGSVSGGASVGGLVGGNNGTVSASFWDIESSGQDWSDGGTGLLTNEMQTISTFTYAGWDFVGETVNGIEDIWFIPQGDYPHLWWEGMHVPMKLTPRTLNCRSEGNWVKAHLTLPQGFTVEDVDPDRPAVLHSFGFESLPLYVFVNKDELVQIEAAFERQAVCSLAGNWPQMLTVAGFLADGNIFLGTSTVRIIHPGMKVIEELVWYWLNEDCVHPDFCNQIDMNRDSLMNLADYALLMKINVEFVTDE
jgi:hypothetical protein